MPAPLGTVTLGTDDIGELDALGVSAPPPPVKSLLPPNSVYGERALESSTFRLGSEGPDGIKSTWNAGRIPTALLPWLAWAMAVDAWDPDQPESVRRASISNSIALKQIKGTLESFRRIAVLHGAQLLKVQRPPNKTFAGASLTRAQRDAFLKVYRQLRIKTFTQPGLRLPHAFYCRRTYPGPGVDGVCCVSDARERLLPRAYLYEPRTGKEMYLGTTRGFADFAEAGMQAQVPGSRQLGTFSGKTGGKQFMRYLPPTSALQRLYTVKIQYDYDGSQGTSWKTLTPGIDPISVYPEFAAQPGIGTRRMFTDGSFMFGWLPRTSAPTRLWSQIYLFDPSRAVESRGKTVYLGAMRLGMAPYTAELMVRFPRREAPRQFSRFMAGFLVKPDYSKIDNFRASAAWTKSARDQVWLDTRVTQTITAEEALMCSPSLLSGGSRGR